MMFTNRQFEYCIIFILAIYSLAAISGCSNAEEPTPKKVGLARLRELGAVINNNDKWNEWNRPDLVKKVNLTYQVVKDDDLVHLRELPNLTVLNLNTNSWITAEGLATIAQLRSVEELYVCYTQLDDVAAESFRAMKNLHTLYIGDTRIGDRTLGVLAESEQLRFLWIEHTAVTREGVDALQSARPRLQIYSDYLSIRAD